jgi:hypothetical protein
MYAGRYSVAGKRLHPLAIKSRGKKQPRGRERRNKWGKLRQQGEKQRRNEDWTEKKREDREGEKRTEEEKKTEIGNKGEGKRKKS